MIDLMLNKCWHKDDNGSEAWLLCDKDNFSKVHVVVQLFKSGLVREWWARLVGSGEWQSGPHATCHRALKAAEQLYKDDWSKAHLGEDVV